MIITLQGAGNDILLVSVLCRSALSGDPFQAPWRSQQRWQLGTCHPLPGEASLLTTSSFGVCLPYFLRQRKAFQLLGQPKQGWIENRPLGPLTTLKCVREILGTAATFDLRVFFLVARSFRCRRPDCLCIACSRSEQLAMPPVTCMLPISYSAALLMAAPFTPQPGPPCPTAMPPPWRPLDLPLSSPSLVGGTRAHKACSFPTQFLLTNSTISI